jgi:threonine/homoserine/homoserine lactone efflux protein
MPWDLSSDFLAYLAVAALIVVTPGMSTALVLRNTAEGGRLAGLASALGISLGNVVWASGALLGLAAILARSPGALGTIRIAGALAMAWLGFRSLASALRGWRAGSVAPPSPSTRKGLPFAQGVMTNLVNPVVPVVYMSTVPQFIAPAAPFARAFAVLAGVHIAMALSCHAAYALTVGHLAAALSARGRGWVVQGATGVALLALGAKAMAG